MKLNIKNRIQLIKSTLFKQPEQATTAQEQRSPTNEFKDGVEPSKKEEKPYFKPTNKKTMFNTIGRDARPHTKLSPPVFEEDLKTSHTPHIAFMNTIERPDLKGGFGK